jgi:hypothetical protein
MNAPLPAAVNGKATSHLDRFALSPHLAKKVTEYADSIRVAAPSEKLNAFKLCARQVFGLGEPDQYPLREKVDRLQATADAHGLTERFGVDAIQQALAEARADPLIDDEFAPRLDISQPTSNGRRATCKSSELVSLATVKPEATDWLWHHRIPRGAQTISTGWPGVGKSQQQCDLVAHTSTGTPWPDGSPCPCGDTVCSPVRTVIRRQSFRDCLPPAPI